MHKNVRPETIKLLEENIGKTISDINHSKILYGPPPRYAIKKKYPQLNAVEGANGPYLQQQFYG